MLKECIPFLFGHLRDHIHSDIILNILLEIAGYEPTALATFLPTLKEIGESFPSLIGQTAKIFGAVGHIDEVSLKTEEVGWLVLGLGCLGLVFFFSEILCKVICLSIPFFTSNQTALPEDIPGHKTTVGLDCNTNMARRAGAPKISCGILVTATALQSSNRGTVV